MKKQHRVKSLCCLQGRCEYVNFTMKAIPQNKDADHKD